MSGARRRFLQGSALAGAGAVAAPYVARAEGPVRWRMVTAWPKNLPGPGVSAQRLCDRIAALSGGRFTVDLFAAGEIVPAFEVFDAVGRSVAEIGHAAAVFWQGRLPAAPYFLAVPFGLTPLEHQAWIEQGGGQELWDALYADSGVRPFLAGNTGMSMGGWFKRPIESLDDLQGLRWRMPGLGGAMYRHLGVQQVSLPPGDTLPALQTGAIDAAEFAGPASDLALGFYKVAPYYYGPGIHEPNGTGECLVNSAAFDGLDTELQAIVRHACAAENSAALAESEGRNTTSLSALVEKGVELRTFPTAIVDAARPAAAGVLLAVRDSDPLSAKIYDSYKAWQARTALWSDRSMAAFLKARGEPS